MKINVIIERGADGMFSCYVDDKTPLKNGVIGYGTDANSAKSDFMEAYKEAVELFGETPDVQFMFVYDMASFLQVYGNRMSLAGLQAITGINRKQLNHYVTGHSKPSPATIKKIANGIKYFQEELSRISFL